MDQIQLHAEDIEFTYAGEDQLAWWIVSSAEVEERTIRFINIIFCSDDYLLQINQEHLDHDYYTDIITFHYHEEGAPIESDLFISIDRVRDNALQLEVDFKDELDRVIIHGVLHMCGYSDKTEEDQAIMRGREDMHLLSRMDGRELC